MRNSELIVTDIIPVIQSLTRNNGLFTVNTGAMAKCSEANEHMSMDVPTVYTSEDLAAMVKNKVRPLPNACSSRNCCDCYDCCV